MRKFRFIGDSSHWEWEINPVNGYIYSLEQLNKMRNGDPLEEWHLTTGTWAKNNWEVVTENESNKRLGIIGGDVEFIKLPTHKDTDLGYFAGLAMQAIMQNERWINASVISICEESVFLAKKLLNELDKENER